ncbi:NAD-dependent malic enzyme [Bradymonas sediminis]|uniref:malate dehydrogenase (oxaloacetate-decarboxylating) n=1 Tax=Bradymonas sediminis TaxID=1548548 RepID=A0A2Z4FQ73_9DELT|nr:NAD-dependent malic enzyme [Bradymonas sediminis]AWV91042.1 NAD-dependent malic enzyme [Bradymonas sediminis]TDP75217.1 NAD-dependent malic enzyme [Bradymonas sediminis]
MSKPTDRPVYISYAGPALLDSPLLNKGSAFTPEERIDFNLIGLLPSTVETIKEQVARAYSRYLRCTNDLDRHIFLRGIQDDNETVFYRLLEENLEEMMPIIYTPTVGEACENFSKIYRNYRGIFVSYPDRDRIDDILRSVTKDKVKVIVVTDGERILGLGDQGIGGMGIPIGKLSLYTACGGISPAYTLPILLDVGTDNQVALEDPMYMGWRHPRINDEEYHEFIELFIQALKRRWPNVLLQFEDFALDRAMPIIDRYRDRICSFNDDVQGTAAVCLATLTAACMANDTKLREQRIAFVGAGVAGCGIAEQLISAMQAQGLSEADARQRIYMVDKDGLLTDQSKDLDPTQRRLAHPSSSFDDWPDTSLSSVVAFAKPTILIGVSGQRGLFSKELIETMHANCPHPVIMPLSNPTDRAEATPADILEWTDGQALVATGSPFGPVTRDGKEIRIAQCNNAYIFPGIGLGVVASQATRVTDNMLMAAAVALAEYSPIVRTGERLLLPPITEIQALSKAIAFAVGRQAQVDHVALRSSEKKLKESIERNFWRPRYRNYRRSAV